MYFLYYLLLDFRRFVGGTWRCVSSATADCSVATDSAVRFLLIISDTDMEYKICNIRRETRDLTQLRRNV